MKIDFNISSVDLNLKLDRLIKLVLELSNKEDILMATLAALEAQVQANTDVEASAILLIQGIAAQLAAAGSDPAKVQALSDQLKASAETLSAAILANTLS